LSNLHVTVEYN